MHDPSINLLILRHGEAGSAAQDRLRALTLRGKQQIKGQCQWLMNNSFQADCILHSPYLRTTESAMIASDQFPDAIVKQESLITPDGHPEIVAELIPNLGYSNILLISHMPLVSYLTSTLSPATELIGYPIAGMCWLKLTIKDTHSDATGEMIKTIASTTVIEHLIEAE